MYKLILIVMLGVLTIVSQGAVAEAAEVKALSTTVMMSSIVELAPQVERDGRPSDTRIQKPQYPAAPHLSLGVNHVQWKERSR